MLSANKSVIADEKGLFSLLSGARRLEAGLLARTKSSIPDVERLSTAAQRLKASLLSTWGDSPGKRPRSRCEQTSPHKFRRRRPHSRISPVCSLQLKARTARHRGWRSSRKWRHHCHLLSGCR